METVLVCGLGAFGQAVIARLLPFGVPLRLIDLSPPDWRYPEFQQALQGRLTIGDMRKPHVLRLAGADRARAVLLLSSDGGTNIEAALQVRLLNEGAEVVIRSTSELDSLGSLLQLRLPHVAVVNPLQLSAGALVQALRPGHQLARFEVNGEPFEVRRGVREDQRYQRPVRLETGGDDSLLVMPLTFYSPQADQWAGDNRSHGRWVQKGWHMAKTPSRILLGWCRSRGLGQLLLVGIVLGMALIGLPLFGKRAGWVQGLFVTSALLKGEYVDPTNVLLADGGSGQPPDAGLVTITLAYSLVGTVLSSLLVAWILDQWLTTRLGMRRVGHLDRRAQPILLVGGGGLATRVAAMLHHERHTVVRVESEEGPRHEDKTSLFVANREQAESLLRQRPVRAVALLSGTLLTDLQDTLQLQALWPGARFALLARSEGTEERLGHLLGEASCISPIEIGADVVVATAFGERVEGVWRIQGQNLLQVRYRVTSQDGLVGRTVTRLEHGYGLTVLSLLRPHQTKAQAVPSSGTLLAEGDQLVVLASLPALRRVELACCQPEGWALTLQLPQPLSKGLRLTIQQCLVRHLGISPLQITDQLALGTTLRFPVDPDNGALVARDLRHQGIQVDIRARLSEAETLPAEALE